MDAYPLLSTVSMPTQLDIGHNPLRLYWLIYPTHADDRNDFAVFEGAAILHYLTKHYDPENKLSFDYNSDDYSVSEQWIAWQHGGVGPMYVLLPVRFHSSSPALQLTPHTTSLIPFFCPPPY